MRAPAGWRPAQPDRPSRRRLLAGAAAGAAMWLSARPAGAKRPVSFGLTPVFLDSDIQLLAALEAYLAGRLGRPVQLVKRRTYQEITALLLSEQLDAAWICGFPLVQYPDRLTPIAVPVYRGRPLYQSYVILHADHAARRFEELRGTVHAFSDPDSNSGFLVTRHLLAQMGERPESFFGSTFFTYGHRNVIRAVASGLAQSGSVDGYVWDVVSEIEPRLTEATRILRRSEPLGFPPVACNAGRLETATVQAIAEALLTMAQRPDGARILATLRLDGFAAHGPELFAEIARKYREVLTQA